MSKMFTRQSVGLVFEYTINTVLSTALMFWALRHYSPQEMGVLAKIQAEVSVFSVLLTLALDTPLLNKLGNTEVRGRLLGAALMLRAAAACSTLVLSLMLALWSGQSPSEALPWLIVVLIPQALSAMNVFGLLLFYDNKLTWVPRARTGVSLLFSAVRAGALVVPVPLFAYTLLGVAEGLFGVAVTWWCYRGHRYDIHLKPCLQSAKMLLTESAPLLLSSFLITCFFKLDLLLVAPIVTPERLADYSVAQRIVECYLMVLLILLNQGYVGLTTVALADKAGGVRDLARSSFMLIGVIILGHFYVMQPLLLWFFKGKYAAGVELSGWLLCSLFFTVMGTLRGYLFIFYDQNNWHVPSALLGIACLAVATPWATAHYGIQGAAGVLVVAQGLSVMGSTLIFGPLRQHLPTLLGLSYGRPRVG